MRSKHLPLREVLRWALTVYFLLELTQQQEENYKSRGCKTWMAVGPAQNILGFASALRPEKELSNILKVSSVDGCVL